MPNTISLPDLILRVWRYANALLSKHEKRIRYGAKALLKKHGDDIIPSELRGLDEDWKLSFLRFEAARRRHTRNPDSRLAWPEGKMKVRVWEYLVKFLRRRIPKPEAFGDFYTGLWLWCSLSLWGREKGQVSSLECRDDDLSSAILELDDARLGDEALAALWKRYPREATEMELPNPAEPTAARHSADRSKSKRRRGGVSKPLTEKQADAVYIVGQCKGNFAAVAKAIGRDRKTVKQHYEAGMKKLGKTAMAKPKTTAHPRDQRGQEIITDDDRVR